MHNPPLEVVVWGEYACFTRPEMKVERVSYPVMTPSAARGILEAIFWKPEMFWRIREIVVLKPIKWFHIKRNEVSSRASYKQPSKKASDVPLLSSYDADVELKKVADREGFFVEDKRTQRATLMLRDVRYLIRADIHTRMHTMQELASYRDQFRRRVEKGRCFHRPAFGCREFAACFAKPDGSEKPPDELAIQGRIPQGRMLLDLDFNEDGSGTPVFFDAWLEKGVLKVPQDHYDQLRWAQTDGGYER
ncbi:MAG: type I-C CRISPR-associated protein Cas5c [Candidatus Hatepunaea meridiana]|nr:type I-C CRISPR-associated protein Cas5c [Candidatus Hatepunaea meridiana]